MTSSAILNFLHTPLHFKVYDIEELLHDAHRLHVIGRLIRRIGAAVAAVTITEVARNISSIAALEPQPLRRSMVYSSSAIASVFALVECVFATLFVNVNASARYHSPRLDDQFNGSNTAMIMGAVAVIVLIIGSMTALLMVWKVTRSVPSSKVLEVVSAFAFPHYPVCIRQYTNILSLPISCSRQRSCLSS